MRAETAKLLRAVVRLVEDDVRDIAESVVEIDEREAAHSLAQREQTFGLERRIAALEQTLVSFNPSRRV